GCGRVSRSLRRRIMSDGARAMLLRLVNIALARFDVRVGRRSTHDGLRAEMARLQAVVSRLNGQHEAIGQSQEPVCEDRERPQEAGSNARRDKLLKHLRPSTQRGIEIGALDKPIITPEMGDIKYVDYAPSEELRRSHGNTPTVDVSRIVSVDYVWGDSSLREAIGSDEHVDYVVASHVLEHVPDLVTWFHELAEILEPGGIVSLIVPDKRFIFDRLRRTSSLSEVIEAWLTRLRKPSVRQVFD